MEDIKPKKERKFLKSVGKVAGILLQEFVLGLGRKFIGKKIDRIGNKRQALLIFLALFCNIAFASVDSIPYPITGNKQRLGWQTTGNGLVWRGRSNDTITKPTSYVDKNVKAYLILDSVRGTIFVWRQTYWDSLLVGGGSGGSFTQPFDSLFFDTTVPTNNVDTAKMRWDSDLGTVVLGMYDQVPNELGFKSFWLVKNQTGSTITKGSIVYANGTVGASGRITVAKFIANGTIEAKYLLGVTAHDLTDGEDGYVISFGKIRQVNTDTFAAGAILYPSPTVAGVWTDVEPVAPNIDMPIGFCINSSSNNGTIAIRVASGYKLSELHDVQITSPVNNASLYYKISDGLWRDTTAALLVSDTASMLANYATKAYADTTGRFYARQDFSNVSSSTLTWTQSDTLIPGGVNVVQVYRNGQILLPSQYTIPTSTSVVIASASYKAGENYTVIFPRGGGAGSGGGLGSLTSISAGTGITVSPNPITTTGTVSADLSVLMELSDTVSLSNRINTKQNTLTLTTTGTSGAATLVNSTLNIPQYSGGGGSGTVTSVATGYGINGGPITTTGTLLLDSSTVYNYIRDSIVDVQIGNDTIKILKQEYNNVTSDTLTWTITSKFPIQLRAYILLFRNGQLLINDQYSIIDTNKIKVAATSYKLGENYTVVTVSGIGSVSSGQGNPVYPEAGIALSTGTTWTTSIPNNSTNWNTAYTDRLKWDGGSSGLVAATGRTSLGGTTIGQSIFTLTNPSALTFPQFNADNTVTALSASSFRGAIGAGTVTSVTAAGTAGNPLSITNTTTTPTIELLSATSGRNGYLTSTDWTTFNNKQSQINGTGFVKATGTSITYDNSTYLPLTGGTLTGALSGTSLNLNAGIDASGNFSTSYHTNVSALFRGYQILVAPNNDYGSTRIHFPNRPVTEGFSDFGSGIRHKWAGSDARNSFLSLYTSNNANLQIDAVSIDASGNVGIRDTTPSYTLDVNGTLNATGATTLGSTLAVSGATTLSTTTATPTVLLGKDGSNVVGQLYIDGGLSIIGSNLYGIKPSYSSITGTSATYSSDYMNTVNALYIKVNNNSTVTITLPSATSQNGKSITVKNLGTGAVNSNSNNVEPFNSTSLGTSILSSGGGKWATLVSDGTNWVIMQAN